LKHVAVFRQVLAEATRDLDAEMADSVGRQTLRAGNRDELERNANARVQDYLSDFLRRWQRILNERQATVDSPEEHARVKNACPPSG
jgi:dsDNA-specific endonuclease/ATPase MutS2